MKNSLRQTKNCFKLDRSVYARNRVLHKKIIVIQRVKCPAFYGTQKVQCHVHKNLLHDSCHEPDESSPTPSHPIPITSILILSSLCLGLSNDFIYVKQSIQVAFSVFLSLLFYFSLSLVSRVAQSI
jgi:hypothetical protein